MSTTVQSGRAKNLMVLFLLLLVIALVCVLVLIAQSKSQPDPVVEMDCGSTVTECQDAFERQADQINRLRSSLDQVIIQRDRPQEEGADEVIVLSDAAGFSFASGSATPQPGLAAEIEQLTSQGGVIATLVEQGFGVMVTGHTDQSLIGRNCSRDADRRLRDGAEPGSIRACDNAMLSLQRAWVVADSIRDRIPSVQVTVSGASFTDPVAGECPGRIGFNDPCSRRVEIRLIRTED